MDNQRNSHTAKQLFTAYLEDKGLRKTPERCAILGEIYDRNDHFARTGQRPLGKPNC